MRVTLKQLKDLKACESGIAWFKGQKKREVKSVLRHCVADGKFSYANWFVTRLFTKPRAVAYSIFASEQCLKEFEILFPNDKRPRQAIEAAKTWLKSPTEENRSATWSAAWSTKSAAESAKSAAESAAWSAWSTAESARSTAESARSAAESARSAAESAAWSAWSTRSAAESAVIEKAIEILGL
jgi:hypothetical protein